MPVHCNKEIALLYVMVEEYVNHRLPRLFHMYDKVESGTALSADEFDFLCRSVYTGEHTEVPLTISHPDLEEFYHYVFHLYRDICERALAIEQKARGTLTTDA